MPTVDELLQEDGLFYMQRIVGPALRNILGRENEVKAWYRRERISHDDGTYHEENWFLTPNALVKVLVHGHHVMAESYMVDSIRKVKKMFEIRSHWTMGGRVTLRAVLVTLEDEAGIQTITLPAPDANQEDRFLSAYWDLAERLG